jgi:hypothetical protein
LKLTIKATSEANWESIKATRQSGLRRYCTNERKERQRPV